MLPASNIAEQPFSPNWEDKQPAGHQKCPPRNGVRRTGDPATITANPKSRKAPTKTPRSFPAHRLPLPKTPRVPPSAGPPARLSCRRAPAPGRTRAVRRRRTGRGPRKGHHPPLRRPLFPEGASTPGQTSRRGTSAPPRPGSGPKPGPREQARKPTPRTPAPGRWTPVSPSRPTPRWAAPAPPIPRTQARPGARTTRRSGSTADSERVGERRTAARAGTPEALPPPRDTTGAPASRRRHPPLRGRTGARGPPRTPP